MNSVEDQIIQCRDNILREIDKRTKSWTERDSMTCVSLYTYYAPRHSPLSFESNFSFEMPFKIESLHRGQLSGRFLIPKESIFGKGSYVVSSKSTFIHYFQLDIGTLEKILSYVPK